MTEGRHSGLDAIRGIAVMGILLLNIFTFAMPRSGYINPRAWGGAEGADLLVWAFGFVLFEGKMRGLFSLLFGAGLALVHDRAKARGECGLCVNLRRLVWLGLFGLAHRIFVWDGDILVQYALVGVAACLLLDRGLRTLGLVAVGLLTASVVTHAAPMAAIYALEVRAEAPGASAALRRTHAAAVAVLSAPGGGDEEREVAHLRGSYAQILGARAADAPGAILSILGIYGLETLGLMTLGAALLRGGLLTGGWSAPRLRRWAIRAYLLGLPPLAALAWWNWRGGFDALDSFATAFAWAEPFKYLVTVGHAALAALMLHRLADTALFARVAAAGRMAFTNYLVTSIVMTTIFYGYGLGLYGTFARAELYAFVFVMWALMLGWSQPWLARFRYGPLEWLWRTLARGQSQPWLR